jgi:hypothetical protein
MRDNSWGRRFGLVAVVALACALVPPVASAKVTLPPGASEGDQYFEVVPNGDGKSSIDRSDGDGGPPVAAASELNNLGPEGKATADLAQATRPPAAGEPSHPASAEAPSSDGMGTLLWILLGSTLLAAVVYGLRRRIITV